MPKYEIGDKVRIRRLTECEVSKIKNLSKVARRIMQRFIDEEGKIYTIDGIFHASEEVTIYNVKENKKSYNEKILVYANQFQVEFNKLLKERVDGDD